MQFINFGERKWSKIVCGTNAVYGRSHFSAAKDLEYKARFSDEAAQALLRRCLELGINAVETSANERIWRIVQKLRTESGRSLHLAGSTRIDETSAMKAPRQKIAFLIEIRAELCVIHAQLADFRRGQEIPELAGLIAEVKAAGLLAGVSTHRISTVELCEQRNYGVDAYLFPLNLSGFVYPGYAGKETVVQRSELVRKVKKPFILMKVLGAGRIPPQEGLPFVLENSKPEDLICIGFGAPDEVNECVEIMEKHTKVACQ